MSGERTDQSEVGIPQINSSLAHKTEHLAETQAFYGAHLFSDQSPQWTSSISADTHLKQRKGHGGMSSPETRMVHKSCKL